MARNIKRKGRPLEKILIGFIALVVLIVGGTLLGIQHHYINRHVLPNVIGDSSFITSLAGSDTQSFKEQRAGAIESLEDAVSNEVETLGDKIMNIKEGKGTSQKEGDNPSVPTKAQIAIVLDDFGYNGDIIDEFNNLDIPLTYAVIPYHTYSKTAANSGYAAGRDIMVHLPMESQGHQHAEDTTISTSMSSSQIEQVTENAIDAVPHAIGLNNHQGSAATSNSRVMKAVLSVLKNHDMFYLDSRTAASSVGAPTARHMGVPTGVNELFIDNTNTTEAVETELDKATNMALKAPSGYVIIIGHARPHTLAALQAKIDDMKAQGIQFVLVRKVLH